MAAIDFEFTGVVRRQVRVFPNGVGVHGRHARHVHRMKNSGLKAQSPSTANGGHTGSHCLDSSVAFSLVHHQIPLTSLLCGLVVAM